MQRRQLLAAVAGALTAGCIGEAREAGQQAQETDATVSTSGTTVEVVEWRDDVRDDSIRADAVHLAAQGDDAPSWGDVFGCYSETDECDERPDWPSDSSAYEIGERYLGDDDTDREGEPDDDVDGWLVFHPDDGDGRLEAIDVRVGSSWQRIARDGGTESKE